MMEQSFSAGLDTWLDTLAQPVGAPPAMPEAATTVSVVSMAVSTETAVSKLEVATVSAMPEAPLASFKKLETAKPVKAPVDPLRQARVSRFRSHGIPAHQAERLADILAERDYTLDDWRACAECASFHDGRCLQGRYPVGQADVFTLHRCVGFKPDEVPSE